MPADDAPPTTAIDAGAVGIAFTVAATLSLVAEIHPVIEFLAWAK